MKRPMLIVALTLSLASGFAGRRVYIAAFNSIDSQYAQHLARVSPG